MLKQILVLIVVMLSVGFGYYFFHDVLARSVLEIGVIPWVIAVTIVLFVFARFLGFLFDTKKATKITRSDSASPENKKLDLKMLTLGLLVGLLITLPMIVVFVWLYSKIG